MSEQCGLTTEKALQKLRKNIEEELKLFTKSKKKSWYLFITDMFNSDYVPFTRCGLLILILEVILYLIVLIESKNIR